MATIDLGIFYPNDQYVGGPMDTSVWYSVEMKYDSITRSGLTVTVNNAHLVLTRGSSYSTQNRIAYRAGIGGSETNIADNITLNPARHQWASKKYDVDLGYPSTTSTGTSIQFSISIGGTGFSNSWENHQGNSPHVKNFDLSCPPANPTFLVNPVVANITETSMVVDRGETNIKSIFYYRKNESDSWHEMSSNSTSATISGLSPNTTYHIQVQARNASDTSLTTNSPITTETTYKYPYLTSIDYSTVSVGSMQRVRLYNPLARRVTIYMRAKSINGTQIYSGDTTAKSLSFSVPINNACNTLGASETQATAYYYCTYGGQRRDNNYLSGTYQTVESLCAPSWDSAITPELLINYADVNSKTVKITGSNQLLVQRWSLLRYGVYSKPILSGEEVPAAKSYYNSIVSYYESSVNGSPYQKVGTSSNKPNIDAGSVSQTATSVNISVRAVDGRGYHSNPMTRTIRVLPYNNPTGSISVGRDGGYGETVLLTINPIWAINNRNAFQAEYSYKKTSDSSYTNSFTTSTFDTPIRINGFNNDLIYNFKVILIDQMGSRSDSIVGTVGVGEPIMFIDEAQTGVGVNCFPDGKGLYVKGHTDVETLNVKGKTTMNADLTSTGLIKTTQPIFGYRYNTKTNAPAFVFDKPGSHYSGIGAGSKSGEIQLGPVSGDYSWIDDSTLQRWHFKGSAEVDKTIFLNNSHSNILKAGTSHSWRCILESDEIAPTTISTYTGWMPILQQKTPNGVYGLGAYSNAVHLIYMPDGDTGNSPRQLLQLGYNGSLQSDGKEVPRISIGSSEPSNPQKGDLWFL